MWSGTLPQIFKNNRKREVMKTLTKTRIVENVRSEKSSLHKLRTLYVFIKYYFHTHVGVCYAFQREKEKLEKIE